MHLFKVLSQNVFFRSANVFFTIKNILDSLNYFLLNQKDLHQKSNYYLTVTINYSTL